MYIIIIIIMRIWRFGVQLLFEAEILLYEAGELCFILRCLLGLELGHIQDFRNSTPRVPVIMNSMCL